MLPSGGEGRTYLWKGATQTALILKGTVRCFSYSSCSVLFQSDEKTDISFIFLLYFYDKLKFTKEAEIKQGIYPKYRLWSQMLTYKIQIKSTTVAYSKGYNHLIQISTIKYYPAKIRGMSEKNKASFKVN